MGPWKCCTGTGNIPPPPAHAFYLPAAFLVLQLIQKMKAFSSKGEMFPLLPLAFVGENLSLAVLLSSYIIKPELLQYCNCSEHLRGEI